MPKLLFSKQETAETLGVSLRTVDNLIVSKELTVRRVGRRVLIPVAELDRFVKRDHATKAFALPTAPEPISEGAK